MTTPIITKHLVKLPAAGKGVLLWLAIDGQQVGTGETIARFTVGTVAHHVTASGTGRLSRTTPDNITLIGGSVVGWVSEGEQGTAAITSQKPLQSPVPSAGANTRATTETRNPPRQVQPAAPKVEASSTRRNAHVEPLEVVPITEPEKPTKSKKRRMVVRSFTISKADDTYLMNTARRLRKHADAPDEISESLLIRVGIAFLNSLSDEGIIKHLQSQIKTETKAGVGAGRRRRIR